jgi:hypothetical protein
LTVEAEETEMSNPHDDPGHRPPPPRQGEPPSYHGGPPPPYQSAPPPYQGSPPPGPSWQAPGPAPGYAPRTGKSFFGALLDTNFDHMITTRLVKLVYVLAIILISCNALAVFAIGAWVFQLRNGWFLGFLMMLFAPVAWLFQLVITRIFMEFVINQFKITEHLKAMREREG